MDAWATDQKIGDNIVMLADGSANLANGNLVSVSLWIAFGLKGKKSRNQN
jgi:peroxiredoxin